MLNYIVAEAVQKFLNEASKINPELLTPCNKHEGKILSISVTNLKIQLWICIQKNRWLVYDNPPNANIDGEISGTLNGLIKKRDMDIKGDIDFIQDVSHVVASFKVDWEEVFAHYLGDEATAALNKVATKVNEKSDNLKHAVKDSIKHFINKDNSILIGNAEMEDFLKNVDDLDAAVERIEAKISYLEQKIVEGNVGAKD